MFRFGPRCGVPVRRHVVTVATTTTAPVSRSPIRGASSGSGGTGLFRATPLRLADDDFAAYHEIDNATPSRCLPLRANTAAEFVMLEKVHGSNFGVHLLNGKTLRFAKRSGFMPITESFFGYHCLITELSEAIRKVHQLVLEATTNATGTTPTPAAPATTDESAAATALSLIVLHGELFGGHMRHPDAPKSTQSYALGGVTRGISPVQKDDFPQYTPSLAFVAFDIRYRVTDGGPTLALPFDTAQAIMAKVPGLRYLRPLMRGPLDKLLAFDVERFTTTMPLLLGHGNCYLRNNRAEGVVVRHVRHGQPELKGQTTIIKLKSSHFQELRHPTAGGAVASSHDVLRDTRLECRRVHGPQLPDIDGVLPPGEAADGAKHLVNHICEARLAAVMSKIGPDALLSGEVSQAKLAFLLATDALKDFLKEAGATVACAPLLQRREYARYALFEAKRLVAAQWEVLLGGRASDDGAAAAASASTP